MAEQAPYVTLTDQNFQSEVLEGKGAYLVDFWATWCPPCRAIAPAIEQIAREFEGIAKVGKLDVDENPRVAGLYNIRSIPTILYFKDGQLVDTVVGAVSKAEFTARLNAIAEKAPA